MVSKAVSPAGSQTTLCWRKPSWQRAPRPISGRQFLYIAQSTSCLEADQRRQVSHCGAQLNNNNLWWEQSAAINAASSLHTTLQPGIRLRPSGGRRGRSPPSLHACVTLSLIFPPEASCILVASHPPYVCPSVWSDPRLPAPRQQRRQVRVCV